MDAGERGAGADDDRARAGAFLRWVGAAQEYAGDNDAKFRADGFDHGDVGTGGLQFMFWRKWAGDWRVPGRIFSRCGRGSESRLLGDDTADNFHGVPVDVCNYHAGVDYGSDGRA